MPSRSLSQDTIREIVDAVARSLEAVPRALEQQLSAIEVPLPAPTTPERLVAALRSLREAAAQVDLLRRLLAEVAGQGARAALFVLRDGRLVGWEGTRFDDEPELAGDISTRALPQDAPAVVRVLTTGAPVACSVEGDTPVPDFGQTLRGEAWLYPLRVMDRVAAVLYVDPSGQEAPDLHGIAVLVEAAGLVVERMAAARARSLPTAAPASSVSQPVAAAAQEQPEDAPAPSPGTVTDGRTESDEHAVAPPAGTIEHSPPEEPEPAATAEPAGDAPAEATSDDDEFAAVEVALELEGEPEATESGSPAAEAPEPGTAKAEATAPGGEVQAASPDGSPAGEDADDTGAGFEIMTPEELGAEEAGDAAEEDARRFARLLMQEIMLYHRDAVEQGRATRSILARLADPIANARRLYEQRVPESHPARMAWFEEEMIRVLAEGDPDLLGQPEGQEA